VVLGAGGAFCAGSFVRGGVGAWANEGGGWWTGAPDRIEPTRRGVIGLEDHTPPLHPSPNPTPTWVGANPNCARRLDSKPGAFHMGVRRGVRPPNGPCFGRDASISWPSAWPVGREATLTSLGWPLLCKSREAGACVALSTGARVTERESGRAGVAVGGGGKEGGSGGWMARGPLSGFQMVGRLRGGGGGVSRSTAIPRLSLDTAGVPWVCGGSCASALGYWGQEACRLEFDWTGMGTVGGGGRVRGPCVFMGNTGGGV